MTMKKIAYFLMTLVAAVTVFSSCSDDETYAVHFKYLKVKELK